MIHDHKNLKNCQVIANEDGVIMWRLGSGDNVELAYVRATEPGSSGQGQRLFIKMLEALKDDPPYHSVFGFSRVGNLEAHAFYRRVGFVLTFLSGMYADGSVVFFREGYETLCRVNGITLSGDKETV